MKRFRFQQETLLSIKRQLKSQAELKLQNVQGRLTLARNERALLIEELDQLAATPLVTAQRGGRQNAVEAQQNQAKQDNVWQWLSASQQLQAQLAAYAQKISQLEVEKEECLRHLRELETQVESLQTLRDRQVAIFRTDNARHQNYEQDETAMRMWQHAADAALKGDTHG